METKQKATTWLVTVPNGSLAAQQFVLEQYGVALASSLISYEWAQSRQPHAIIPQSDNVFVCFANMPTEHTENQRLMAALQDEAEGRLRVCLAFQKSSVKVKQHCVFETSIHPHFIFCRAVKV